MDILVLGGNGFIGINLVQKLIKEGNNVYVYDKKYNWINKNLKCKFIMGEFSDIDKHAQVFKNIDIVYHLISTTTPLSSNSNIKFDIESNVINTVRLLEICVNSNVRKVIFVSSGGTIYGSTKENSVNEDDKTNPICSYGISKMVIEKYLYMFNYLYGLDYQVLRISNPYGPYQNPFSGQGVIGVFLAKILNNEDIRVWGNGSVCRDYIFIDDVVEALYLSAIKTVKSKILNIGRGKGCTLNEIIDIMKKITQKDFNVIYEDRRNIDIPKNILDIAKAVNELNWEPRISIKEGIKVTSDWYYKNL